MKTYVNLPLTERDNVAAVIDGKAMSWHVAKIEVEAESEMGTKILRFLDNLELLKKDD